MSRDDYLVERVHLGEASPEEEAEIRQDPALLARVQELDEQSALFRATFPADEQLEAIQRKLHVAETRDAVRRRNRTLGAVGLFMPLAVAAAVLMISPELIRGEPDSPMENRAKGLDTPTLAIHRKIAGDDPEPLTSGTIAAAGDVLQLSYRSGGAAHGVVASVDGSGNVSLHHPASVTDTTALSAGGFVELPHGYALDDAPRYERFFLVTGDAPLDVRAVLSAADALPDGTSSTTPLELPEGLGQTSFLVRKATP